MRRTLRAIVIYAVVSILPATARAEAPKQFDLVCKVSIRGEGQSRDNVDIRARIDLASGQFCFEECSEIPKIVGANSDEIVLSNLDPVAFLPAATFNRQTNSLLMTTAGAPGPVKEVKGTCTIAPFSGFPTR